MTPSALFFFSKSALAVPGLLCFLMGFRITLLIFIKKGARILSLAKDSHYKVLLMWCCRQRKLILPAF